MSIRASRTQRYAVNVSVGMLAASAAFLATAALTRGEDAEAAPTAPSVEEVAPGLAPGERYATSNFPRNSRGLTYGSAALASSYEEEPDLIAVVGKSGRVGFIHKRDAIQHPEFATGEEAAAWSDEVRRNPPGPIPVYDLDGVTKIDTWSYGIAGIRAERQDGTVTHLPEVLND